MRHLMRHIETKHSRVDSICQRLSTQLLFDGPVEKMMAVKRQTQQPLDLVRPQNSCPTEKDPVITFIDLAHACHVAYPLWDFTPTGLFDSPDCHSCSFRNNVAWKAKSWRLVVFLEAQYFQALFRIHLSSPFMKISFKSSSTYTSPHRSALETSFLAYCNGVLLCGWENIIISSSVLAVFSSSS